MRLLHVDTLELHEFFDDQIPPYAILSHRWEQDEVSHKDVRKRQNLSSRGWQKVRNFCQLVRREEPDLDYAWMDTCCIDKRSSAELSEAINSMYKWYRKARVCFAYLSDVDRYSPDSAGRGAFMNSVWFTRGWTLQELIAPKSLCFVSSDWLTIIGTKETLAGPIADVTRIDKNLVESSVFDSVLRHCSIARRMSWASARVCAREEDQAYCLLGLFDVNMPLLYGEGGEQAFIRLQTEILKISDDESIFAWAFDDPRNYIPTGMLARSPRQFRHANNIIRHGFTTRSDYVMTNKGLKFEAIMGKKSHLMYFALNCCEHPVREKKPFMVFIVKLDNRYMRCEPNPEEIKQGIELSFVARLLAGRPQTFYITGL
jgi:hypothetical protein